MDLKIMPHELINSKVKLKLFQLLMSQKTEITAGELAKMSQLPVMTVSRLLGFYCSVNAVYHRKAGNLNLFRINADSYLIKMLGGVYDALRQIKPPFEGLKDILSEKLPVKLIEKAYLYGSVASGRSGQDSDIDLFVVASSAKDIKKLGEIINGIESHISRAFGNTLVTYMLTAGEYQQKRNLPVIKEAEKGIRII